MSQFLTLRDRMPETHAPWALCPEPTLWSCYDGGGAEVETLCWLEAMVYLLKPRVIVETGAYLGWSAAALALGCRRNGFGHVFTFEIGEPYVQRARTFVERETLAGWVTVVHGDARSAIWSEQPIDLMFCDGGDDRVGEILRFEPHLTSRALVIGHDGVGGGHYNPQFQWHRLEDVFVRVLFPTPRGLWVMQRRGVEEIDAARRDM